MTFFYLSFKFRTIFSFYFFLIIRRFGVRVNAVIPGFIKSPMTDVIPEHIKRDFLNRSPSGRMGNPEEVAEVIAFLSSDKSSFVNGASIEVTGGFH